MTYQNLHFMGIIILVTVFSIVAMTGKNKSSFLGILFFLLMTGTFFTLFGLGISWWASGAAILDLAIFKDYYFTLGFIRVYLLGVSFLLTIPALITGRFALKILGSK